MASLRIYSRGLQYCPVTKQTEGFHVQYSNEMDQFDALEGIEGPSEVSCIDMQGKILIGLGLDRSC